MRRWAQCRERWCWARSARWPVRSSDIPPGPRLRVPGELDDHRDSASDVQHRPGLRPGNRERRKLEPSYIEPNRLAPRILRPKASAPMRRQLPRARRQPSNLPSGFPEKVPCRRFRDSIEQAPRKNRRSPQKCFDKSGKSPAYLHHRKNFIARAGKPVAGFFNRTATRKFGRNILPCNALSPGVAKRVAVRASSPTAGTRGRAGARRGKSHVRPRPPPWRR